MGGAYSYTNLAPALPSSNKNRITRRFQKFHDGDANFRIKTSKTGILKYYAYFSKSRLDYTVNSIDSLGYWTGLGFQFQLCIIIYHGKKILVKNGR
jgi:hypothetical protein